MKVKLIKFAESTEVVRQKENIDKLLRVLYEQCLKDSDSPSSFEDWMPYTFVSDLSNLGDFVGDEDLPKISAALGFEVHLADYLKDVALRMGPKN